MDLLGRSAEGEVGDDSDVSGDSDDVSGSDDDDSGVDVADEGCWSCGRLREKPVLRCCRGDEGLAGRVGEEGSCRAGDRSEAGELNWLGWHS